MREHLELSELKSEIAPTILLFMEGKEVFRQSRIVVFAELERALQLAAESL